MERQCRISNSAGDATHRGGGAIARADRLPPCARHAPGPPATEKLAYLADLREIVGQSAEVEVHGPTHFSGAWTDAKPEAE